MAVKKKGRPHSHYTGKKRRDTAKLSEMLAPLEEQDEQKARAQAPAPVNHNHDGAIVVDSSKLRVPSDFGGSEGDRSRILGFEPVVLFILLAMLAFIAFIAYLISLEPPRT
jgi:hypothetical protein